MAAQPTLFPNQSTQDMRLGDCLDIMRSMKDNCITHILTDPPYGSNFMGKQWDNETPAIDYWKEALRICKPGAILLCFGGTRTFHRLACAIEDAGWEIRDCLMWVYGSGFPKSLDLSKSIDKKRDDYILHVTKWINIKIKESGKSFNEINEFLNLTYSNTTLSHWSALTLNSQPRIPPIHSWLKLKEFLNCS